MTKKNEDSQHQSEITIEVVPEALPCPLIDVIDNKISEITEISDENKQVELGEDAPDDLNLHRLPVDFGSTKAKGHAKPKKIKRSERPDFKVKSVFDSPTKYKTTTSLPTSEQIRALWLLPQEISERITSAIADIYSYVARRGGKGGDTFFVNVAVTAEYELSSNMKRGIKGKNHRLKTGVNAKTIEKTIRQIDQVLAQTKGLEKEQKALLKIWRVWFRHQLQIYDSTIEKFSEADLHRLEKDFGYSLKDRESVCLTPSKKQIVLDMHPKTPEGKQSFPDGNTPKSLTTAMQETLKELWNEKEPNTPEKEEMSSKILTLYEKHKEVLKNVGSMSKRKLFENDESANKEVINKL